jgi:hypothetical protein
VNGPVPVVATVKVTELPAQIFCIDVGCVDIIGPVNVAETTELLALLLIVLDFKLDLGKSFEYNNPSSLE